MSVSIFVIGMLWGCAVAWAFYRVGWNECIKKFESGEIILEEVEDGRK